MTQILDLGLTWFSARGCVTGTYHLDNQNLETILGFLGVESITHDGNFLSLLLNLLKMMPPDAAVTFWAHRI